MSYNIRRDPSGSMHLRVANSFRWDATKKPPEINCRDDQSLVSFLDFLYQVALENPNIFFGWFRDFYSDLATLSLARSPAIKARFACFKDCFDRELMGSWIEATASRSVMAPPHPPQEVACSNLYFGYLQVACEQQTHFRSSLLSIFRRERSDDRKCVCCPQANNKVTPKTIKSAICRKLPQNWVPRCISIETGFSIL